MECRHCTRISPPFVITVFVIVARVPVPVLQVHDEEPQEELPSLRTVAAAHPADVTQCAFSYPLSMIVTGARDGSVRMWDFQDVRLQCDCVGHNAGVSLCGLCHCLWFKRRLRVIKSLLAWN